MRRLPEQAGVAIRKSVNAELIDLSVARNVKALTDHAYGYRLQVGNYRVFFDFLGGDVCIVSIEEVRKRDERTY
jgi:mRNA-degrading endonuclease RelE of RelBE toxin-antitoxin system